MRPRFFHDGLKPCRVMARAVMWLVLASALVPSMARSADTVDAGFAPGRSVREFTFKQLGAQQPLRLRGATSTVDLPVSVRNDELVTGVRLHLRYAHAPAPGAQELRLIVLVNGEALGSLPLKPETADGGVSVMEIDPRALVGDSRLGLRLDGPGPQRCSGSSAAEPWVVIGNDSGLELVVQRLPLASDLGLLPEPFFDRRDHSDLVLPVVLPPDPSREELQAAGILASWFGALAEHRGVRFPVQFGKPSGREHALVVGTRARLGEILPAAQAGAELRILDHPHDPYAKLLVVTGGEGASLLAAARGLTLGTQALAGPRALIRDLQEPVARPAYDAPRWVPTDRPVRLGERMTAEQLQFSGGPPSSIRMPWNLPPDLFDWKTPGARVDLAFRYMVDKGQVASLDVDVNNRFIRSLPLPEGGSRETASRDLRGEPLVSRARFHIPAYHFGSRNEVKWQFNIGSRNPQDCNAAASIDPSGAIDPDSTIDFSPMPHYTELPDLRLFADGAFPYSKYADLAQTIAVLSATPSAAEIETFLRVMAHIGNRTGVPATRLRVADAAGVQRATADADLLVFGTPSTQPLLVEWARWMPLTLGEAGGQVRAAGAMDRLRARFDGRDLDATRDHATRLLGQAGRSFGAILSFESPLAAGRTVVVFAAPADDGLRELSGVLDDAHRSASIGGDLTLINPRKISNYALAAQFSSGELPLMLGLRWWLSRQPLVLALITVLLSTLMALILFVSLQRKAHSRRFGG